MWAKRAEERLHAEQIAEHDVEVEQQRLENLELHPEDAHDYYEEVYALQQAEKKKKCWEVLAPKVRKMLGIKEAFDEKPHDYWSNPIYHTYLPYIPFRAYLQVSMKCKMLIEDDQTFNNFVTGVIIVAGIMVGIQTYELDAATLVATGYIDLIILAIFTLEVVLKIIMEGLRPYRYFTGPEWKWNCFDFMIVALSMPFVQFGGGSSIKLLRLVRLARLGKLIRKIPPLQMIVKGLIGGLSSISYILLLLVLILYLYGVMAFYAFSTNSKFHFSSVPLAMMTLFRVASLSNWGDIFFLNVFGCEVYPNVYVAPWDETPRNHMFWCRNPVPQPVLASLFFVSFIVLCSFVMLSLFIGAVCMSMNESMEELKAMEEENQKAKAFESNKKRMTMLIEAEKVKNSPSNSPSSKMSPRGTALLSPSSKYSDISDETDRNLLKLDAGMEEEVHQLEDIEKDLVVVGKKYNPLVSLFYSFHQRYKDYRENLKSRHIEALMEKKEDMCQILQIALGEKVEEGDETDSQRKRRLMIENRNFITKAYVKLAHFCNRLCRSPQFNNTITFVILLAAFNVGMQSDDRIARQPNWVILLSYLDLVILAAFTADCVLKIIGEELHPLTYFNDSWNCFDFIIVVGSYMPGAGSTLTLLRLLRLLRVLKLVKRLPQLAVIVNALIDGMGSIGWVGLVLFLFMYVFAIVGMILFQESDPWHYGTLHSTLINLFRMATLDNWTEKMYIVQYGCDVFEDVYAIYKDKCTNPVQFGVLGVVYYFLFVIVGAQVLLSLFIGVIATSMDAATDRQNEEKESDENVVKVSAKLGLNEERTAAFREVFDMLDLDGGGTIDMEEVVIGLEAVNCNLSEDELVVIMNQVDPKKEGVDPAKFMQFMSLTPLYKKGALLGSTLSLWKKKEHVVKVKNKYVEAFKNFFIGGKGARRKAAEMEAALSLQAAWKKYKAAKKAKADIAEKKRLKELKIREFE